MSIYESEYDFKNKKIGDRVNFDGIFKKWDGNVWTRDDLTTNNVNVISSFNDILDKPKTLNGYGIIDACSKDSFDSLTSEVTNILYESDASNNSFKKIAALVETNNNTNTQDFNNYVISNDLRSSTIEDTILEEHVTLQSLVNIQKNRIDGILDSVSADKDSFQDIVNLINQVDLENDSNFAAINIANNIRFNNIEASFPTKVDKSQVLTNVPLNAKFTDTIFDDVEVKQLINDEKQSRVNSVAVLHSRVDGVAYTLNLKADKSDLLTPVPAGAVFTDTVYDDTALRQLIGTIDDFENALL